MSYWHFPFLLVSVLFVLLFGFILVVICGYFSGLVGVTASPGSAIIIGGLFLIALSIKVLLTQWLSLSSPSSLLNAAAITILIGSIMTGAASIANDNIQDLKVGYILGATPWKQQVMLLLGVATAAAVIPLVMQLLFNVYGIADVLPNPNMDPSQTLVAPPAAMMAAVTQAVFKQQLPWNMVLIGVIIAMIVIIAHYILHKFYAIRLSVLALAMGIYLPLTATFPLFIGSYIAYYTKRRIQRQPLGLRQQLALKQQSGAIMACGLVAGAALVNVILAIPFAVARDVNLLRILPAGYDIYATVLGFLTCPAVAYYMYRKVVN